MYAVAGVSGKTGAVLTISDLLLAEDVEAWDALLPPVLAAPSMERGWGLLVAEVAVRGRALGRAEDAERLLALLPEAVR